MLENILARQYHGRISESDMHEQTYRFELQMIQSAQHTIPYDGMNVWYRVIATYVSFARKRNELNGRCITHLSLI